MILIVDSGATKSDWIALDEKGKQLFLTQTLGLSPEVLTREVIEDGGAQVAVGGVGEPAT